MEGVGSLPAAGRAARPGAPAGHTRSLPLRPRSPGEKDRPQPRVGLGTLTVWEATEGYSGPLKWGEGKWGCTATSRVSFGTSNLLLLSPT